MTDKEKSRLLYLRLRADLGSGARLGLSKRICRLLEYHPVVTNASTVLVYWPMRGEVDLRPLIQALWKCGKVVLLPRTNWCARLLVPVHIFSESDVISGRYGVPEPRAGLPVVGVHRVQCAIVPGLSFTLRGQRLGYGGGFYDRFLATAPSQLRSIGAAFGVQIAASLPFTRGDRRVDLLATEAGVLPCAKTKF